MSERMLILSADFLPQVGGVSFMVHHLANALVRAGVDTAVLAPLAGTDDVQMPHDYRVFADPQGTQQVVPIARRRREDARLTRRLSEVVDEFEPTCVLLGAWHCYDRAALRVCRRRGIPLGVLFHGYDLRACLSGTDGVGQTLAAALLRTPTRRGRLFRLVPDVDALFTNSHYTADLARRAGARTEPTVLGCGLPREQWQREFEMTPRYDPALKAIRRRDLGLDAAPMVTYVGRLVPQKNVETLLRAVAEVDRAQCLIVGEGPESQRLMDLSAELGLSGRITFTGAVEEPRKWEYLRVSDVFCLPSRELPNGAVEGFGIVLLEAAAAGAPVIGASTGGMVDVVEHERTGLRFDPQAPPQLAAAIDRLLHDPDLATRCLSHARDAIKTRFNWDAVAQRVIEHLRRYHQTNAPQPASVTT